MRPATLAIPRRYGVLLLLLLLGSKQPGTLAVEVNDSANGSSGNAGGGGSSSSSSSPSDEEGATTLDILRCCPAGEDLAKPVAGQLEIGCEPTRDTSIPLIYSDGSYLHSYPSFWRLHYNSRPKCAESRVLRYVLNSRYNPYILLENGVIVLEGGLGMNLSHDEYCLGINAVLTCLPKKTEGQQAAATMVPKLRKCCGENAAYDKNSCVDTDTEPAKSLDDERKLLASVNATVEIVSGFPVCPRLDNFTIVGDLDDAVLQADASLIVDGQLIPTEEFCIERVKVPGSERMTAKVFACSEHAAKGSSVPSRDIRFTLYPIGFIISAIFLAATLAAGWLLPASHHVLHWRCQTHHVACLMLGDISMAVIQLAGNSLQDHMSVCRVIAILAHFFFLATFFWLNTMCFNIWWTFRDLRPASLEKGQELLRLRFYAAYAWGGPLIVAGLAAILDHVPQTPGQTFLRPRFGEKECWFYGDMEILTYFFGPIGVLLAVNLLFFAATARELTCGLWKGEFVKSTTERSRAIPRTNESPRDRSHRRAALGKVCLKLVVVMGVPWIFDVISWMAGGPAFLWYLTDLLNAAQGVLIFIVVGCQPQVRAALKRLWSRNPRANANRQGNGLSTTSHGMPSMGDSVTQNPSTKTAPLETIC